MYHKYAQNPKYVVILFCMKIRCGGGVVVLHDAITLVLYFNIRCVAKNKCCRQKAGKIATKIIQELLCFVLFQIFTIRTYYLCT